MLKVLLYGTYLLVLEMVQSALMTSRHLHEHTFDFKPNKSLQKRLLYMCEYDIMGGVCLKVSVIPL